MNMNPGSYDAVKAGCTCPVEQNNHGRTDGRSEPHFFVNTTCPVHTIEWGYPWKPSNKKTPKKLRLPLDFWKLWRKE